MDSGHNEQLSVKINHKSDNYRVPRTKPPATVRFTRWSLGVALRLFIWYSLVTALFRCPSNLAELDGLSPQVCHPYLVTRSHLEPYVLPYYETYAAPYVNAVQPYAHNFHRNIYVPTKDFTVRTYRDYAAPRQEQTLQLVQTQWNTAVTPRLHAARDSVVWAYGSYLKPYHTKVKGAVLPVYHQVASYVDYLRKTVVSPLYTRVEPVIQTAYSCLHDFAANHMIPATRKGFSVVVGFANGTLRPRIAGLYFENVEPQLIKIGKKLASYREGKENGPRTTDEIQSTRRRSSTTTESVKDADPPSSTSTMTSASSSEVKTSTESASSTAGRSPQDIASEKITSDLRLWQEKFAVAADKGCEDLEERIVEIVGGQLDSVNKGEELVGMLESTAQVELDRLKATINDIVRSLPDEISPVDRDTAQANLLQALRSAGMAIREPAHALRQWSNRYRDEVEGQVAAAVSSTLDVLDGISDLGLQEMGMRWAWMDGVTYKHWAKYHALKKQLSEWRSEVNDFGMKHETFLNAKAIGTDILSRGMAIAEDAAKQLTTLKEVGTWKIEAGDDSDDFTPRSGDPAEFRESRLAALKLEQETAAGTPDDDVTGPSLAENDSVVGECSVDGQECIKGDTASGSSIVESLPLESEVPIEIVSTAPPESASIGEDSATEASAELTSSTPTSPADLPSSSAISISELSPSASSEEPSVHDNAVSFSPHGAYYSAAHGQTDETVFQSPPAQEERLDRPDSSERDAPVIPESAAGILDNESPAASEVSGEKAAPELEPVLEAANAAISFNPNEPESAVRSEIKRLQSLSHETQTKLNNLKSQPLHDVPASEQEQSPDHSDSPSL